MYAQICILERMCYINRVACNAPVSQLVEETASKSVQCGFESHRGHRFGAIPIHWNDAVFVVTEGSSDCFAVSCSYPFVSFCDPVCMENVVGMWPEMVGYRPPCVSAAQAFHTSLRLRAAVTSFCNTLQLRLYLWLASLAKTTLSGSAAGRIRATVGACLTAVHFQILYRTWAGNRVTHTCDAVFLGLVDISGCRKDSRTDNNDKDDGSHTFAASFEVSFNVYSLQDSYQRARTAKRQRQ